MTWRVRAEVSRANAVRARATRTAIADERAARFAELLRGGYTTQEACWELRISRRTARRYKARLRAAERGVSMPWVRFDDQFPIHRKVSGLSDSAFRLHVEGVCWSVRNLTDGFVPASDLHALASARRPLKFVPELVVRGSWHLADEPCESEKCPAHADYRAEAVGDGWIIHDFFDYQWSRAKVVKERKAKAARQARWLEKKNRQRQDASRDASQDLAPSPPRPKGGGGTGSPRASGAAGRTGPRGPAVRAEPWCGECDERTRQIELDGGALKRCPTCHPLREEGL